MGDPGFSRREAIGKLSLGALLLLPLPGRAPGGGGYDTERVADTVIAVRNTSFVQAGDPFSEEQEANVRAACSAIRPANHVELAYTVACGEQLGDAGDLIEEFVLRRDGAPAKWFADHPRLALRDWGSPDTHRILIFGAQLDQLFRELTAKPGVKLKALRRCPDAQLGPTLHEWLCRQVREKIQPDEFDAVVKTFRDFLPRSGSYFWASGIAQRVERALAPPVT